VSRAPASTAAQAQGTRPALPRNSVQPNGAAAVQTAGYGYGKHGSNYYGSYDHNHGPGHYHGGHYYPYPHYASHNHYYHYYYPHYLYPYGYGAFGLGFFYYDPYVWAPTWYYNGYNYGYGYGYPVGEIRLQVRPNNAEVYVDGYYAGLVDDFDGSTQGLRLEEGTYHIEIVADGFEPIEFDAQIQPGRKINYRGDMLTLRQ
jgi:hypothetical protein